MARQHDAMNARLLLPVAVLLCTAAGAAQAAPALGATVGTTGIGLGLAVPISERLGFRAEVGGADFSRDFTAGRVDYDGRLRLRSLSALLDVHPWRNAFRLSTGLVINDSRLGAIGTPAGGRLTVNGITYPAPPGERLNGDIKLRPVSPYLGIGFGHVASAQRGWGVYADLGVTLADPRVKLSATPMITALAGQANIDAEARELQAQADRLRLYPVVRVGLRYNF